MKRIQFNKFALAEMIEAAKYYEKERTDLGKDFLKRVKSALFHIQSFPSSGTQIEHGIRRFHYSVIYSEEKEYIYILSIMKQRRHPENWRKYIK